MTAYDVVLIAHLFGLAIGLGGAVTLDSIILIACRRSRATEGLVEVVHIASGLVVGAMALLAVSGAGFFAVGVEPTPKFWAKMVIVGIACLNGLAAHRLIFPLLENASADGSGSLHFSPSHARLAAASAAVSAVSWSGALILGAWSGLSLAMMPILAVYGVVLGSGILLSAFLIAPTVFIINPGNHQGSPIGDWKGLPAKTADAIAHSISDPSLAITDRLRRKVSRDRSTADVASAYEPWLDWLSESGAISTSRENGITPVKKHSGAIFLTKEKGGTAYLNSNSYLNVNESDKVKPTIPAFAAVVPSANRHESRSQPEEGSFDAH